MQIDVSDLETTTAWFWLGESLVPVLKRKKNWDTKQKSSKHLLQKCDFSLNNYLSDYFAQLSPSFLKRKRKKTTIEPTYNQVIRSRHPLVLTLYYGRLIVSQCTVCCFITKKVIFTKKISIEYINMTLFIHTQDQ